ncbi:MAG: hypothetical protein COT37_02215 [Parcubacteria group bacterium CG08_land_8_20_14_0_20_43_9]|nr:MAG: hypothetical protein COT37_02215 [Parcubacteria group bacterium CG08_land_8_20_14_0_20_43_9]
MTADANKERVAIIGAGITGLYLAWRLRQKGHSVVVFEKKDKIGGKPCTGLVSERIKEYMPIGDGLYQRRVESVLVHFEKKDVRIKVNPAYLVFERRDLDNFVYNLAKGAGAEIVFNHEIKEIPDGFDRVIGCDGAQSRMRRILSLSEPVFRLGTQYFVGNEGPAIEMIEVWPKKFDYSPKYGFIWKVQKVGETEYGIIGPKEDGAKEFEIFLDKQKVELGSPDVKAALIPQELKLPKSEKITLLGDSAGMTKPTTGGGIVWGLKAGDILADCFPDFLKYRRKARLFFLPKILKGKIAVFFSYFLGRFLPFLLPKTISVDPDLF